MTPRWRALVVRGDYSADVKTEADGASGAYAVREKDGHRVVYVGESSRGRMWRTMLRHFQAPESFRKVRERGVFTRSPERYEVALWVTSKGERPRGGAKGADQAAMKAQAEWIRALDPASNVDDGEAYELPTEDDDPWGGLLETRANPSHPVVELGRLTALEWKGGARRFALMSAPRLVVVRSRLLIVYPDGAGERRSTKVEDREYARLHWGSRGKSVAFEGRTSLGPFRVLGVGTSITYTTAKGEAALVDWEHAWGEGARTGMRWRAPTVIEHRCSAKACDASGLLALRGGTYRVSARGIVG